jgi:hypothetical protein
MIAMYHSKNNAMDKMSGLFECKRSVEFFTQRIAGD